MDSSEAGEDISEDLTDVAMICITRSCLVFILFSTESGPDIRSKHQLSMRIISENMCPHLTQLF